MITDSDLIDEAIARITGKDAFFPLSMDDFKEICPHPTLAYQVLSQNADEAADKIQQEWEQSGKPELSGMMAFIQSTSMTMDDLAIIDKVLPRASRIKKGLDFTNPDSGLIDIWVFAETL